MGRIRHYLSKRFGRLNLGVIALLLTLGIVLWVYVSHGGAMFSPGELNGEPRRDVLRGGVQSHADLASNCSACHAPAWSRESMASRCLDCHTNVREQIDTQGPMHGRLADNMRCGNCHTEHKGTHAALTTQVALDHFDHDCAAFKLTGAHRRTDCNGCHTSSTYQGTPQKCASCHADPPVHKGRFGLNCGGCHSTSSWANQPGKLTNLRGFDHDLTRFNLTGKHRAIDCISCHKDSKSFAGTPTSCAACHEEPKVHKGRFSTTCSECHTTHTWAGAEFKHTIFSMTHRGSNNRCAACHNEPDNLKSYTCYNCHEHTPEKEARRHARRNIANVDNCISCHGRGKRGGRERTEIIPRTQGSALVLADQHAGCPAAEQDLGLLARREAPCPIGMSEKMVDQELARFLRYLDSEQSAARQGKQHWRPDASEPARFTLTRSASEGRPR
jgi:hypothetical protein